MPVKGDMRHLVQVMPAVGLLQREKSKYPHLAMGVDLGPTYDRAKKAMLPTFAWHVSWSWPLKHTSIGP